MSTQTAIATATISASHPNITIQYAPTPAFTSYNLFGVFPKQQAKEFGEVIVEVRKETKTRLSFTIRMHAHFEGLDWVPKGSEKFKMHLTGRIYKKDGKREAYFVVSSNQRKAQIEEHIRNLVAEYLELTEDDNMKVTVHAYSEAQYILQ